MSVVQYLLGTVALVVALGGAAVAAACIRGLVTPGWVGAPARLAETVVGVAVLVGVGQLLGAFGLFESVPIALGCAAVGLGAWSARRRVEAPSGSSESARGSSRPLVIGAFVLVSVVALPWLGHTVSSLRNGMFEFDTLSYHGPMSALFVRSGWATRLPVSIGIPVVTNYPANSELLHALAIVPFHRDWMSPIVNMGWFALALVAGWCIGRPYGRSALTMSAVAVVLTLPTMSANAGSAQNDVVVLALFLAAVALIANSSWQVGPVALAGVAVGLAAGTKLNMLSLGGVLAIAVLVSMPRARRRVLAPWWLGTIVLFAAYWYVRNWLTVGNPLPWLSLRVGPVRFDTNLPVSVQDSSVTIVGNLSRSGVWAQVLRPGLRLGLGPWWWLLLGLALAGCIAAVIAGSDRLTRAIGVTALAGTGLYMLTPGSISSYTSAGLPTDPRQLDLIQLGLFSANLRYAAPILGLGLIGLAVLPALRKPNRQWSLFGALAAVTIACRLGPDPLSAFDHSPRNGTPEALVVLAAVVVLGLAFALLRSRMDRRGRVAVAVVCVLVAVAGGYAIQRSYLSRRYRVNRIPSSTVANAYPWARTQHHTSIAQAGDILQYPFFGTDLSNRVSFVPAEPYGNLSAHCREFRRATNAFAPEFVVASRPIGVMEDYVPPPVRWAVGPGTRLVFAKAGAFVVQQHGPLDPAGCAAIP